MPGQQLIKTSGRGFVSIVAATKRFLMAGLLIALCSLTATAEMTPHLSFRHILPDEVSKLGYINDLAQDRQGFMWFAGANGLARYDGYTLTVYRQDNERPESLVHNYVNRIVVADSGHLWLATTEGLARFDPVTETFTAFLHAEDQPEDSSINDVRDLWQESEEVLWLGTRGGLFRLHWPSGEYQRVALDADAEVGAISISALAVDNQGDFWLGTRTQGVYRYRPSSGEVRHFSHSRNDPHSLSDNDVRAVSVDRHNQVWFGTYSGGLARFDRTADRFVRYPNFVDEKNQTVWDIYHDSQGRYWVGDGRSINLFDPASGDFTPFVYREGDSASPGNFVVTSVFEDRAGDIWLGFFPSGVDRIDRRASAFRNFRHNPYDTNSITDGGVTATFEGAEGGLWIGTGYGLNYLNPERDQIRRITRDDSLDHTLSGNTILAIEGEKDVLWLGVWSGGLNRMNLATGEIRHYLPEEGNPRSLPGREPWDVLLDSAGVLWVATEAGVASYHADTDDFTRYQPPLEQLGGDTVLYTRSIYEDRQQRIWVGAIGGLYLLDREQGILQSVPLRDQTESEASNYFVKAIYQDSRGQLWLGTDTGLGRYNPETGEFYRYTQRHGLPDLVVTDIIEDEAGDLWLSTQQGLARFEVRAEEFTPFTAAHGLIGNLYNRATGLMTRRGELVFGNSKGFSIFDPADLQDNQYLPPVFITAISVLNQPLEQVVDKNGEQRAIPFASRLTLEPHETVLEINYSALGYHQSQNNQYAYRLLGFSDEWTSAGERRSAFFTNLDPGNYRFEVRAANNDGLWNPEVAALEIVVLPPLWRTWWAYALYVLLIAGLLYWFTHTQRMKYIYERDKLTRERQLVQRLQEVDKLKDEFLANTSHELRTPLHGIIGLAESMMEGATGILSQATKYNLAMIVSSGRRLSTLVDDILDFSKLRHRGIKLNVRAVDLYVLVDVVINLSRPLVAHKPIVLVNQVPTTLPPVRGDEDRLLQVLHNLIGNAVKFTERGKVVVTAEADEAAGTVSLTVADTGVGIAPEHKDSLFEAFEQGAGDITRLYGGTGLGLSVSRQLVELHRGQIEVSSTPGEGSRFTVTLPMATEEPDVATQTASTNSVEPVVEPEPREVLLPAGGEGTGPHILIVDDEPVNRQVLVNFLSLRNYRISECDSGEKALAFIEANADVELVLLDLMMPGMSGYEICKTLRRRYSTLELPVIFLTAKHQSTDLVQAFGVGANDFLSKPFSRDELLARVATHLQLLDIHRNLDQKVAERTSELKRINSGLEEAQQELKTAYRKLEQASLTDPLTGLYNRRYLYRHLDGDLRRTLTGYQKLNEGERQPGDRDDMLFMLVDIDHFKRINDQYGHAAGDKVLEDLSRTLAQAMRDTDYLVRWGGEEFLLVARFCNRHDAPEMAERVRAAIAQQQFMLKDEEPVQVTCSVGVAAFPFYPDAPETLGWEQVVDLADRALYAVKNTGRNGWISLRGIEVTDGEIHMNAAIEAGHIAMQSKTDRPPEW